MSAPSGASLFENARFNALVIVPNGLQGPTLVSGVVSIVAK